MASDIWLFHLKDMTSKQITEFEGTDSFPMWAGKSVYYLSDGGPEHRLNIWSVNTETGERTQVTDFKDFDCKWPSMGPGVGGKGEIVFSNGSKLYLLDLGTRRTTAVNVMIGGDRPKLRSKKVDASEFVNAVGISATGKRVVVEARGDIWTAPVKNGSPRNLTATDSVAERDPAWSPDGRWISYLSDATGEYELYVMQSDGRGETKQLTQDGNCFRYNNNWSPDSKHLIFTDKTGKIFLHTIESGETKRVDTDPFAGRPTVSWSHDSSWIAYDRAADDRAPTSSIWLYEVATGTKTQVTSDFFNDSNPAFDQKGEHLFFTSNRSFNSPKYEDVGSTFIYSGTEVIMAMPLRKDVKYPLAPKIDEESWKDEDDKDKDDKKDGDQDSEKKSDDHGDGHADDHADDHGDDHADEKDKPAKESSEASTKADAEDEAESDKKAKDKKKEKEPLKIDLEGLERRSFQLPVGQGNFTGLAVNAQGHLIYGTRPARGSDGKPEIKVLDLSADEVKPKTVVEGAASFELSADRKSMLVSQRGKGFVVKPAAGQKLTKPVSTDGMIAMIQPRNEWKQIFHEAWRLERDYFYDPTMHGVDWEAMKQHYEKMLADCVSRRDVGFVIGEMIAELNVGHAYYREGDVESGEGTDVGVLGCRFEWDGKGYKFAELYEGAAWDHDARNPLVRAGVKEGQYLVEINGNSLSAEISPFELLQGTIGQTVSLTVSDDESVDDKDERLAFKPMRSDNSLRFRSWIEANRKYVADKTDGKVGYIYVVNTGVPGQNDLVRQFYGQLNCEALIIDDRWNGGGQIPTRFIELLNRPATNMWARRDGRDWTWPPDSHQGPKCMLINGMAGSGGDMFPALFRQNKLGKLVGRRTWGGLVGISGGPRLIDGASVTMPSFAYYEMDGTWGIEGHGVDPDIDVIDDPAKLCKGSDPQLDAAIDLMKSELDKNGYKAPKRPAYPDRSKFGIAEEDK